MTLLSAFYQLSHAEPVFRVKRGNLFRRTVRLPKTKENTTIFRVFSRLKNAINIAITIGYDKTCPIVIFLSSGGIYG